MFGIKHFFELVFHIFKCLVQQKMQFNGKCFMWSRENKFYAENVFWNITYSINHYKNISYHNKTLPMLTFFSSQTGRWFPLIDCWLMWTFFQIIFLLKQIFFFFIFLHNFQIWSFFLIWGSKMTQSIFYFFLQKNLCGICLHKSKFFCSCIIWNYKKY